MVVNIIIRTFLYLRRKGGCEIVSDRNRTQSEYIERHAEQHCNGDAESAKEHAIVKEACKNLVEE